MLHAEIANRKYLLDRLVTKQDLIDEERTKALTRRVSRFDGTFRGCWKILIRTKLQLMRSLKSKTFPDFRVTAEVL